MAIFYVLRGYFSAKHMMAEAFHYSFLNNEYIFVHLSIKMQVRVLKLR